MQRITVGIILLLIAVYWLMSKEQPAPVKPKSAAAARKTPAVVPSQPRAEAPEETAAVVPSTPGEPETVTERDEKNKKPTLPYKIRNGLMIVQGDTVAGQPSRPDAPDQGYVIMSPVKTWKHGNIPYHIQPDVVSPERVQQALAMFDGTAVHFTPYSQEEDVLVFVAGDQDCLSYVGQMGGKQPVWISPDCAPADIAHEILHALGFVHEQNRLDRDDYVEMHFDNVDDRYTDNFEKLPKEFMKVSGLGEFDFQSLMIYPPWMFAKNGQSTMEPKVRDKLIQPSKQLSQGDIDRLNKAYAK